MEIFTIRNLSFSYPEAKTPALSQVSFSVQDGDFFVLLGPSGCGKSTLLRQLKPCLTPHGEQSGEILFCGEPLCALDQRAAASEIGFVLQSPDHQIVTDKVWHELAFGLESLGFDTPVIRRRVAEMAAFFGMEEWFYQSVCELSGGQKQLLNLASVMVMQPRVIILDEPASQLDPIAASDFLAILQKINRELGTTVILTEHRLEEALFMANHSAVMEMGKLLCAGSIQQISAYLKAHHNQMFFAMPAAMRVWSSVSTDLPCPITVGEGRQFLRDYVGGQGIHPVLRDKPQVTAGKTMLSCRDVWFRYEKEGRDVVKGLNLSLSQGELFCILGGNGAGKTTTLKVLSGLAKPYRGTVQSEDRAFLLPQNPQTLFVKKTVYEELCDAFRTGRLDEGQEQAVRSSARLCRLECLLDRHPFDLSGGEQQRLALAKLLLFSPRILLLDEPTKGMDAVFKIQFAAILTRLKQSGICICMVSHDIEFCAEYADCCALFFDGTVTAEASPREFFSGNRFYTTSANRMAKDILPKAITAGDLIEAIGGQNPLTMLSEPPCEPPVLLHEKQPTVKEKTELPFWRKIGAAVSGMGALAVFLYATRAAALSDLVDAGGIAAGAHSQLVIDAALILCLLMLALFIGRRSEPLRQVQTPRKKRRLSKRTRVSVMLILLMVPVTLFVSVAYLDHRQYYWTVLLILLESMIPFFMIFEDRRPKARELVIIAVLCALGIAGRAAFFMLPQFKPVMALVIIAGVAFGGETGFLVGAVTMFVSNMLFSQGPWTPWQMFAMGIIGFLAGLLYRKGLLRRTRGSLCVFGAICAIVVYGGIMNPTSALIWGSESLNFQMILSYYLTGFPMDCVHGAATFLFLWFAAEPMLEKLDRIKVKYGLVQ